MAAARRSKWKLPLTFKMPKNKCKQKMSEKKGSIVGMRKAHGTILVFACPTGKLAKNGRCKVSTFLLEKIKPARGKACPVGYKRR